jgi:hypothetical protein
MKSLPLQYRIPEIEKSRLNLSNNTIELKNYTFKNWFFSAGKSLLNDKYYLFLVLGTFIEEKEEVYQLKP